MENFYLDLAWSIDYILHPIVVIYMIGGYFVSEEKYPKFRIAHSATNLSIVALQVIFSFRCPLLLISGYLRMWADPNFGKYVQNDSIAKFVYEPWTIYFFREVIGLSIPSVLVTIITIMVVIVSVWTLAALVKTKIQQSAA